MRLVEVNRFSLEHLLDRIFIIMYYNRRILFIKYYIVNITNIVRFTLLLLRYLKIAIVKLVFFARFVSIAFLISISIQIII